MCSMIQNVVLFFYCTCSTMISNIFISITATDAFLALYLNQNVVCTALLGIYALYLACTSTCMYSTLEVPECALAKL